MIVKKKIELIPADRNQCQAAKRKATAFGFGGDCTKVIRCLKTPIVIATEIKPASDGLIDAMIRQMPNHCTLKAI